VTGFPRSPSFRTGPGGAGADVKNGCWMLDVMTIWTLDAYSPPGTDDGWRIDDPTSTI